MEQNAVTQNAASVQHWHALYTRHQHEKNVAQSLSSKGHEIFLPLYGVDHRWRDRTKHLWLPLFPCYVFIRARIDQQLQPVATPGVVCILQSSGRPAIVPQDQIDAVQRIVQQSLRVQPHSFMDCGDRVRVKAGPLRGVEGLLVKRKGVSRLIVSVEMLGRSASVEVDISHVESIAPFSTGMRLFSYLAVS